MLPCWLALRSGQMFAGLKRDPLKVCAPQLAIKTRVFTSGSRCDTLLCKCRYSSFFDRCCCGALANTKMSALMDVFHAVVCMMMHCCCVDTLGRALGISTLSYAWWMMTNQEYHYSNLFEFMFRKAIKKRYREGGLDEARLAEAQVRLHWRLPWATRAICTASSSHQRLASFAVSVSCQD